MNSFPRTCRVSDKYVRLSTKWRAGIGSRSEGILRFFRSLLALLTDSEKIGMSSVLVLLPDHDDLWGAVHPSRAGDVFGQPASGRVHVRIALRVPAGILRALLRCQHCEREKTGPVNSVNGSRFFRCWSVWTRKDES